MPAMAPSRMIDITTTIGPIASLLTTLLRRRRRTKPNRDSRLRAERRSASEDEERDLKTTWLLPLSWSSRNNVSNTSPTRRRPRLLVPF